MLDLILVQLLFAWGTPLNKALLGYTNALSLTLLRMSLASIILSFVWIYWYRPRFSIIPEHLPLFAQKIIFGSYLKYVLKYWGLQYLCPLSMTFLFYTTPLWTALCNYFFNGITLTIQQIIGIVIAGIGIVPFLFHNESTFTFFGILNLPALAIIGAVIAHSYGVLCSQQLVKKYQYNAFGISAISCGGAAILTLCTSFLCNQPVHLPSDNQFMLLLLVLIFINNVIGKAWYTHLLKQYDATLLALGDYIHPLFVGLISWGLYNQTLHWYQLYSGISVMIGMYIFYTKPLHRAWCSKILFVKIFLQNQLFNNKNLNQ